MRVSSRPLRSALTLALALAAAPALAQSEYSKTVFFGDSLSDTGYFRPVLVQIDPNASILGRFTTNPGQLWSDYLAAYYGTDATPNGNGQNGDNYAVGGARVGVDVTGQLGFTPSLTTQLQNYLAATGGKADPNALYSVWGGANDLFAVAAGAPAQATIGAAVADEVGMVATLKAAGARYVMVPNLPDIGLTPSSRAGGAVAMAQGTALAQAYNDALYGGLKQAGLQVIPVDTFTILQEIVANPGAYGFTNVTDTACNTDSSLTCSPLNYVTPNANQTYVFADGVHPTTAAHRILGEYAVSLLEAPRLQQVLTHSAQVTTQSLVDQVSHHLEASPQDGLHWWANVRGDSQTADDSHLYDSSGPAGLFGFDVGRGPYVLGLFAGYGRMKADFGDNQGNFTQRDTTLGLFGGWYRQRLWINGQASHDWLNYDVTRTVQLGPATRAHSGSPDGGNWAFALNAGYEFGDEFGIRHGPIISAVWQKTRLDGYVETNPSATALGYDRQNVNATLGRIGWQVRLAGFSQVRPYMQVTWDHQFQNTKQASAWLQTLPDMGAYQVPGLEFDRNYITALAGLRVLNYCNVGVSTTLAQNAGRNIGVFVEITNNFFGN